MSNGKCTTAEIDALNEYYITMPSAPYSDLKTKSGVSAGCVACVFSADSSSWHPFVEDGSGQLAELNVGGCMAIATGKVACGRAYQAWFDCRFEACANCPDNGVKDCLDAASNGAACKAAGAQITSACGSSLNAAEGNCFPTGNYATFVGALRAQCGSGV